MSGNELCRGLVRLFTTGYQKGGQERCTKPVKADMDRIEKGCRAMNTASLLRFTATGNPNGRVTDTLNELLRELGERCRQCCVWTLAVVESDPKKLRERAGGILTAALRTEQQKNRAERERHVEKENRERTGRSE